MKCNLNYSINSFSYYKSLCYCDFDIYDYIKESKGHKCSELNPWYGHFTKINNDSSYISKHELHYLSQVLAFAKECEISFQIITVDGNTYIYDENPMIRERNLENAKKWIDITKILGAHGVRFDASLPEDTTSLDKSVLKILHDGYGELISYGAKKGICIYVENHYGITSKPDDMIKILDEIPNLYYLFDSWNWHHKMVAEGWLKCAKRATAIHIKTFYIDESGEDILVNIPALLCLLDKNGFQGCLTIETMPLEYEQEKELIEKTIKLIKKIKEKNDE